AHAVPVRGQPDGAFPGALQLQARRERRTRDVRAVRRVGLHAHRERLVMDWLQRRPLVAMLAAIGVALLLAIGVETGFGTQIRQPLPPPPSKAAAAPEAKLVPPVAAVVPEQAYPETTARPLFVPTRRPAPVELAGKSTIERGQYVLQGVIVAG